MHLRHVAAQREPDAQAALGRRARALFLCEEIEDALQRLGRDAAAVVRHHADHVAVFHAHLQADVAATVGVLRGIGQQVLQQLHEACIVADELHRIVGHVQREVVLACLHQRACGLGAAQRHVAEADALMLEPHLPGDDAADIEQVVHQPRQLVELAVDDVAAIAQAR